MTITIQAKMKYQSTKITRIKYVVPLHPACLSSDFMSFLKSREGEYLFADIDLGQDYNDPFQSSMDRSRRWIQSIYKHEDPPAPHHGFRKWFKTRGYSVTQDFDCVEYMQGHARSYSAKKYRKDVPQSECLAVIKSMFSGIVPDHF